MSARTRSFTAPVHGRTHRSAPTQCGKHSGDNGKWRGKRTFPQRGGTEPAPYRGSGAERSTAGCAWGVASASQIPKRNLGRQSWSPRPTGATQVVPSEGPMYLRHGFRRPNFVPKFGASVIGIGPYEKERKFHQPPGPAAHSGASAPAGARKWVGIAAKIIPKGAINLGQSLSQPAADSSLCTREPWGRGMRIAVTSAPNFGTKFGWRWLRHRCVGPAGLLAMTMDFCHSEERSDVGIRPFYGGRGFGPPSRRPLRVVAESRRNHSGSALSAERVAGQIRSLPDTLRVQHGAQGPELS